MLAQWQNILKIDLKWLRLKGQFTFLSSVTVSIEIKLWNLMFKSITSLLFLLDGIRCMIKA